MSIALKKLGEEQGISRKLGQNRGILFAHPVLCFAFYAAIVAALSPTAMGNPLLGKIHSPCRLL